MKSLEKVFKIVDLLDEKTELKFTEVVNLSNLNKSTVYRILKILLKYRYVTKNEKILKYKIGPKFLNIASTMIGNMEIREIAQPYINQLSKVTSETIHLGALIAGEVIYIDKKESIHGMRMVSQIGRSVPFYCTGLGKAILAFQPEYFIEETINKSNLVKFTKNTITNKKELLKEIDEIRTQGIALDREEHEKGVCCIAAPIRDHWGNVSAALSISAIKIRLGINDLLSYKDLLLEKTESISNELGYIKM